MSDTLQRNMLSRATIGDQLRRHAAHDPDRIAIIYYPASGEREEISYGVLNDRVNRCAQALQAYSVGRGDVVAMMARNSPDTIVAYYATLKLGAAFTGINFTFKEREVAYQIDHAQPKVLIVEDAFIELVASADVETESIVAKIEASPASESGRDGWTSFRSMVDPSIPADEPEVEIDDQDVAMLVYTSGTEAFPKGVMISHRNYLSSTTPSWQAGLGIAPRDRWLFLMPFHTIAGLGSMTTLTVVGASLVLVQALDPAAALKMIAEDGITIVAQTPTL